MRAGGAEDGRRRGGAKARGAGVEHRDGRVEAAPGWMTQLCFWLFIIIALTDYLDGYLARRDGPLK